MYVSIVAYVRLFGTKPFEVMTLMYVYNMANILMYIFMGDDLMKT